MRVITGSARGRRLKAPKGMTTRPTADRVKEALFNILGGLPSGARVLDLFAGSGGLGIEALSRGAAYAVFIDRNPLSCRTIRANLSTTGLERQAAVYCGGIPKILESLKKREGIFTLVFSDPPYEQGLAEKALRSTSDLALLKSGGVFVAEHSCREILPPKVGSFYLKRREEYGETIISIYTYYEEENQCVSQSVPEALIR